MAAQPGQAHALAYRPTFPALPQARILIAVDDQTSSIFLNEARP